MSSRQGYKLIAGLAPRDECEAVANEYNERGRPRGLAHDPESKCYKLLSKIGEEQKFGAEVELLRPGVEFKVVSIYEFPFTEPVHGPSGRPGEVNVIIAFSRLDKSNGMFQFRTREGVGQEQAEIKLEPGDGAVWDSECPSVRSGGGGFMALFRFG